MLEAMIARLSRIGEEQARARRRELAERLRAALPEGIEVDVGDEGVRLSGTRLRRRLARDSWLAWLIAGLLK
jgi:hypothetical protein